MRHRVAGVASVVHDAGMTDTPTRHPGDPGAPSPFATLGILWVLCIGGGIIALAVGYQPDGPLGCSCCSRCS